MRTLSDIQDIAARIAEGIPLEEEILKEPIDEWAEFNTQNPGEIQKFINTKLFKVTLEGYKEQIDVLTKRLYITKDIWEIPLIQGKIHTYRSIIAHYEYLIKISQNF